MIETIKKFIKNIPHYFSIALRMHSLAPNKKIKNLWKILVIGGFPVVLLTIFSGVKILDFIPTLKIDYINNYGGFIFFIFIVIFSVTFFDNDKCKEITKRMKEKQNKV